jgi:hypothetical protein
MTFSDWFRPRIDGSLHWQQALALTIGVLILLGPVSFWWRYEVQPKAAAQEAVERSLGPDSHFEVTEIFNELGGHAGLLPVRTYADTLVCGSALIDGRRTVAGVLARTYHRGRLYDVAVIWPKRPESWRYPRVGPPALAVCARELSEAYPANP